MLSFPFLVWVRMTFACIIPAMFLSEFELAPNIGITSLFYLNMPKVYHTIIVNHVFVLYERTYISMWLHFWRHVMDAVELEIL